MYKNEQVADLMEMTRKTLCHMGIYVSACPQLWDQTVTWVQQNIKRRLTHESAAAYYLQLVQQDILNGNSR